MVSAETFRAILEWLNSESRYQPTDSPGKSPYPTVLELWGAGFILRILNRLTVCRDCDCIQQGHREPRDSSGGSGQTPKTVWGGRHGPVQDDSSIWIQDTAAAVAGGGFLTAGGLRMRNASLSVTQNAANQGRLSRKSASPDTEPAEGG